MSLDPKADPSLAYNRANMVVEKSRRLLDSWLPLDDIPVGKQDAEGRSEDIEALAPAPDLLGLGAISHDESRNGDYRRKALGSSERFNKELLQGKYGFLQQAQENKSFPAIATGEAERTSIGFQKECIEDGSDSKINLVKRKQMFTDVQRRDGGLVPLSVKNYKRGSSYIDEVLSTKAKKTKKKKVKALNPSPQGGP